MASFSLYRLVNYIINDFRPATKFLFQLKQNIKFTELNPTIDIATVPLYS